MKALSILILAIGLSGCYLSTVPCEPEEAFGVVDYLGRDCPEPLHELIPLEPYREVRSSWEGPTLLGCELVLEPEPLARVFGFRLEVRETFPDRPCYPHSTDDDKCERTFDSYREIVFVDETTERDVCSERWGITYVSPL